MFIRMVFVLTELIVNSFLVTTLLYLTELVRLEIVFS